MARICSIARSAENSSAGALTGTTAGIASEVMPASATAAMTRITTIVWIMFVLLFSFILWLLSSNFPNRVNGVFFSMVCYLMLNLTLG